MNKVNNKYRTTSAVLAIIGTCLITLKVDFYLDIVVLSTALLVGLIGYYKSKA